MSRSHQRKLCHQPFPFPIATGRSGLANLRCLLPASTCENIFSRCRGRRRLIAFPIPFSPGLSLRGMARVPSCSRKIGCPFNVIQLTDRIATIGLERGTMMVLKGGMTHAALISAQSGLIRRPAQVRFECQFPIMYKRFASRTDVNPILPLPPPRAMTELLRRSQFDLVSESKVKRDHISCCKIR
jgi:hypothetical protein